MILTIGAVVRKIWRSMWQPLISLPRDSRWWHHVRWCCKDIFAPSYVFLAPPLTAYVASTSYATEPARTVLLLAIASGLWLKLVLDLYLIPLLKRVGSD